MIRGFKVGEDPAQNRYNQEIRNYVPNRMTCLVGKPDLALIPIPALAKRWFTFLVTSDDRIPAIVEEHSNTGPLTWTDVESGGHGHLIMQENEQVGRRPVIEARSDLLMAQPRTEDCQDRW